MKYHQHCLYFFFLSLATLSPLDGQADSNAENKTSSLSFQYGKGGYTVKDAYISENHYKASNFDFYKIGWNKKHQRYTYVLSYAWANGNARNGIVSSDIQEFCLSQGFIYKINHGDSNRKFQFFAGPVTDFFLHYRAQNVARSRLTQSYSAASLISAAIDARIEYYPIQRLSFANNAKLNILSVAARLPDYTLEDYKIVRLQTPLNTMLFQNNFEIKYSIWHRMDIQFTYLFQLMNFSEDLSHSDWSMFGWSEAISISNSLVSR